MSCHLLRAPSALRDEELQLARNLELAALAGYVATGRVPARAAPRPQGHHHSRGWGAARPARGGGPQRTLLQGAHTGLLCMVYGMDEKVILTAQAKAEAILNLSTKKAYIKA